MAWCRRTDTIRFNGTFSIGKKNRSGMSKMEDISTIDKKHFRDLEWLKSNVTKRIILRLTISHYDPMGCFLNISLTNFKIITAKIMEFTTANKYDEEITDNEFLLDVGRHLELLSHYKELLPMRRALISISHIRHQRISRRQH